MHWILTPEERQLCKWQIRDSYIEIQGHLVISQKSLTSSMLVVRQSMFQLATYQRENSIVNQTNQEQMYSTNSHLLQSPYKKAQKIFKTQWSIYYTAQLTKRMKEEWCQ